MNHKFTVGAVTGAFALALAVPALAQFASAQSDDTSSVPSIRTETPDVDPQDAPDEAFDERKGGHVGQNGMREELLTGDDAAKATAAALAAVPGGAIDRVETDAEGDIYEAHMTKADGSRVTAKFDADFNVTDVEEGHGR